MPPPWTTGRVIKAPKFVNNYVDKNGAYFVDKFPHSGTRREHRFPAALRNPLPSNGIYGGGQAQTEPRSIEAVTFRLALWQEWHSRLLPTFTQAFCCSEPSEIFLLFDRSTIRVI